MQFAERWIGSSMIVAGVLALAPALLLPSVMPHRHHRHHHHHRAHLDLAPHGCAEARVHVPPPPRVEAAPTVDAYTSVFEHQPAIEHCLQGGAMVQALVTIAPDGHVKHVSSRPDPETPAFRCVARAILPLQFPASEHGLVLRVPFSAP